MRLALIDMMGSRTQQQQQQLQQQLQLGPRPAEGAAALGMQVLVGQLSCPDAGAHGSAERLATEESVCDSMYDWAVRLGAARDGWFLVMQWQARGSKWALLDVRTAGPVPAAAQQALADWAERCELRVPHPSLQGGWMVVPCRPRPSMLPLHQVKVAFRGLPEAYTCRGAPDAILRAVGYRGGLRVSDVFFGSDPRRPLASDGTVCAYVTPPAGDIKLARLPASFSLGGGTVEVYVSTRAATLSVAPAASGFSRGAPASAAPPPPPPAIQVRAAAGATAAAAAAAWAVPIVGPQQQPQPAAAAVQVLAAQQLPGLGVAEERMSVDEPAEAASDAMAVDTEARRPGMGDASPTRAAAAWRILQEWADAEFPSAAAIAGEVERLLSLFLDGSRGSKLVAQWVALAGDLHPELLPGGLSNALTAHFCDGHGHRRQLAYGADSVGSSQGGAAEQQLAAATPVAQPWQLVQRRAARPSAAAAAATAAVTTASAAAAAATAALPAAVAGPSTAAAPLAQQAQPAPQTVLPRRSPRQSIGQPPGPGALVRGAHMQGCDDAGGTSGMAAPVRQRSRSAGTGVGGRSGRRSPLLDPGQRPPRAAASGGVAAGQL